MNKKTQVKQVSIEEFMEAIHFHPLSRIMNKHFFTTRKPHPLFRNSRFSLRHAIWISTH